MGSKLMEDKDKWLNQDLLSKIAKNPRLLAAMANPEFLQALDLMKKDPKVAAQKYKDNKEVMGLMEEFSKMMGTHFESVAQKQADEDPVMKIINNDEQVKSLLDDPKVKQVIQHMQMRGGLDFYDLMRQDPETALKMKTLIEKGVLNVNNQMP